MEERRQDIKNKEKESELSEKQNVETNNSTNMPDFLDLEALAIWNNLFGNIFITINEKNKCTVHIKSLLSILRVYIKCLLYILRV